MNQAASQRKGRQGGSRQSAGKQRRSHDEIWCDRPEQQGRAGTEGAGGGSRRERDGESGGKEMIKKESFATFRAFQMVKGGKKESETLPQGGNKRRA